MYNTETNGSPHRPKIRQRRSRSTDMCMWERHKCSHIHRETNKPDCMCTHIHTHSSDCSRKAESSGLVVCVTVAPHPGQRYSRRIRSLNFTRHSSRHCRYAIFSTAHTPGTRSFSDKCCLNHILSVWHTWTNFCESGLLNHSKYLWWDDTFYWMFPTVLGWDSWAPAQVCCWVYLDDRPWFATKFFKEIHYM